MVMESGCGGFVYGSRIIVPIDRFRREGDPLPQPPKFSFKRKRAAPRKKSSLDPTQKASLGRLIEPPNFSSTTNGVPQEQELYQEEKILLRAPKLIRPRFGIFKAKFKDLKVSVYVPFEFACGYALFEARGYDDQVGRNFESTEEYIKLYNEVFTLIAYHPFETASDALSQMNYVSKSIVTKKLKNLIVNSLPKQNQNYYIITLEPNMGIATKMATEWSYKADGILRGLRMNICKLINGLQPADLVNAQRDLALNYSRLKLKYKGNSMRAASSSSSFNDDVVVVPHRIEGVFIAMYENEEVICTKNLVPGEAVSGEKLIFVKDENGKKIEYRVWNPLKSKLASAILSGVNDIWVKPGSHVLCLGDVCGITVSHLSDLVGPNGLVYAVALTTVTLDMAKKRSNVIPICEDISGMIAYRMLLSMVDVVCADTYLPETMTLLNLHCIHYLKAGGHYLVSTQANDLVSSIPGESVFESIGDGFGEQYKILELIKLKQIEEEEEELFMGVAGFRTQVA